MYQIISYYMYKHTVSYVLSYSYDRNDDLGKNTIWDACNRSWDMGFASVPWGSLGCDWCVFRFQQLFDFNHWLIVFQQNPISKRPIQ